MAYARKFVKPRISEEAATQLEEEYVKMRAQGAKAVASNVITATPRQLESMIRLAEALAKMRLDAGLPAGAKVKERLCRWTVGRDGK